MKFFRALGLLLAITVLAIVTRHYRRAYVRITSHPTAYYLSPDGSDNADGLTLNTPWKTFHHAQFAIGPGDTLYVRGGSYPNTCFLPTQGGTEGHPITITNYKGEKPVITGQACWDLFFAVYHDWINVYGMTFDNTNGNNGALWVRGANHLSFRHNTFTNNHGSTDLVLDLANYVSVEDNVFDFSGSPAGEGSGDNVYIVGSTHVLVQHNQFSRAGHAALDIINDGSTNSAFNVVRENTIDQYWGGGIYIIRGSHDNVVEHNVINHVGEACGYPKVGLQIAAAHNIVRYNIVNQTATHPLPDNGINIEAYVFSGIRQDAVDNRIYNNDVYGAGRSALYVWLNNGCIVSRNKVANNIFYHNKTAGEAEAYWPPGFYYLGFELYHTPAKWISFPGANEFENNLILHNDAKGDHPNEKTIYYDVDPWAKSLAQVQRAYPGAFSGNIEADPKFVHAERGDFHLSPGSAAINAGADLTQTTAAAQQTVTVPVKDASFFFAGYGVTCGDALRIGNGAPVRIKAVDYQANTLILESPVSFRRSDSVNLAMGQSEHPDIGAIPFGAGKLPVPACRTNDNQKINFKAN